MNKPESEKNTAALNSVLAAGFLTGLKIVVGCLSGSLGILAEAAHSGLDLVAALVTFFAVRVSGRPADKEHLYGHGKVENLSALFEALLLLATCVWIIIEAVHRLLFHKPGVEASIWTFLVMITSIVVDVSRSRMLRRVARKHRSQGLEADALHFSTDVWSSAVVLVGLLGIKLAGWFPGLRFLEKSDNVAALAVALIVVWVSGKLGVRAVQELIDFAPAQMAERIKRVVESVAGVKGCHAVRVRCSGPKVFVDAHVELDGSLPLVEAHRLTGLVEQAIRKDIPEADITVHAEPLSSDA